MPVTQVEAQEFFQEVTAAASQEEQQALILDYAVNNDNPDEMLAAVVQANPAAACSHPMQRCLLCSQAPNSCDAPP